MTVFYVNNKEFTALAGETVLDTLLRYGYPVNYSCKKGRCRSCLLQHLDGELALIAQRGLEPEQKSAGLLFACQCLPAPGLALATPDAGELYFQSSVQQVEYLTDSIAALTLSCDPAKRFQAGQCVNLRRKDGISRSYAIAAVPNEEQVVIHIRRKRNGLFSQWLFHDAIPGEPLDMQGPWGHCHYFSGLPEDTLVLIGSGTGLGAAAGIAMEALAREHKGNIYLYHSGRNLADLYQHKAMLKLMLMHRNFFYQACISSEAEKDDIDGKRVRWADPLELVAGRHHYDRYHRVFLCGEPKMVLRGQERAFLGGVPIERIHVLSFDYRELRKHARNWL
ncbi:CDP-6-deoxy-L-threo-D-glycero-4-hexulose-3-dehydrase reductase [Shewanella sp. NFH-SH190041]|uniref:2Fe-2S iron-sulfur cluster-binding protein n=1 Tax=Shewanella sp. NFH-SH190041 TaxID=2950245 RepID=UPI0021C3B658|nr:2Fe-2S iron-sulfur cluster-binding protein [Shewanella sp. NFH-SH190041]BDM64977.1 CDP-6-deoxy-L-threo-D-glycero-4-hexulose-3-dehydrase reductase [Shewanella sp. NFH-SH190041]